MNANAAAYRARLARRIGVIFALAGLLSFLPLCVTSCTTADAARLEKIKARLAPLEPYPAGMSLEAYLDGLHAWPLPYRYPSSP